MDQSVVADIIFRLLPVGEQCPTEKQAETQQSSQFPLSEGEIRELCVNARDTFLSEPCLLELKAPIKIAGDIHGQYEDLLRLFNLSEYPPVGRYLFLGNYVDFGRQNLETICLLLAFKIMYPDKIFLLRGNHEDGKINRSLGFYDECERRYNVGLWMIFNDCFNCLPFAALIDDKILCLHGGLSPELQNLDDIRNIERPTDVPPKGLIFDLLWSDPDYTTEGWGENMIDNFTANHTFGADKVMEFLDRHDLDLICRGNKVVVNGYEFFSERRLVTIFSAPYFHECDIPGAIMSIDKDLICSFELLHPMHTVSKSNTVTAEPKSSQEVRPFKIDPATLYRSKVPGVKRFPGARV